MGSTRQLPASTSPHGFRMNISYERYSGFADKTMNGSGTPRQLVKKLEPFRRPRDYE